MKKKNISCFSKITFKCIRWLIRTFYGKTEIIGLENLPPQHTILVANHTQMNGPIIGELFLPSNCYIWCAGQMMDIKEVPAYAFDDFWSQKPKWTHPFFRVLSYLIAPLASCIFNNARTLAVYHDSRVLSTFKESITMLQEGKNLLIFTEKDEKLNNILYQFQDRFIDLAKLYYRKTGVELTFVPMYTAPSLHKAYIGQGITYNSTNNIADERSRIINYLIDEITRIARDLPEHTVIPYRNIPKKYYLSNKAITEVPHEKTSR